MRFPDNLKRNFSDQRLRRRSYTRNKVKGRSFYYMDIESPSNEVSNDLARESLIAISNSVPDNALEKAASPPETFGNANGAAVINGDTTEKYRSELISISYVQSPDAKPLPVGYEP